MFRSGLMQTAELIATFRITFQLFGAHLLLDWTSV